MTPSSKHYTSVPFTRVEVRDSFWAPRIRTNRDETITAEYRQLKDTGRIEALRLAWKPGMPNRPHIFWDSDVAKWIEAASYSLATHADATLRGQLDQVTGLVIRSQQPDGYINSHSTVVEPEKRWTNLRDNHELYCAGHLIEAAIAHFLATGQRRFLDAMCRYADYIGSVFGVGPGQKRGYPGHEEIELALVKLYRASGDEKYLSLSKYFVDERGTEPNYFVLEARRRGEEPPPGWHPGYHQAHVPVREQSEVTGHAVRAMYLYSAMADLARETGDKTLLSACKRLWKHATGRLLYVTGGLGSSLHNEGFTFDYDLPNETAYCETCAAVGLVFWAHRMLQIDCDSRYGDVMERALYNAVASGVSLDGKRFFYENPLASIGRRHRQDWFGCACCPPNIARLYASLGGYAFSQGPRDACIHLYIAAAAQLDVAGQPVTLTQETAYPWDGLVRITLDMARPSRLRLRLRRPGWCRRARLWVNGKAVAAKCETDCRGDAPVLRSLGEAGCVARGHSAAKAATSVHDNLQATIDKGYFVIDRTWRPGDEIRLTLDMPVTRVYARPRVRMDCGRVALQRGPIVYCIEGADNGPDLDALSLPRRAPLKVAFEKNLLGGVATIRGSARRLVDVPPFDALYRDKPPASRAVSFKAVPYAVWDNRAPGEMLVWMREDR